jgi:hypothetical protein
MAIADIASGIGASDALKKAAAKAGMDPEEAQATLQGVIEHVTQNGSTEQMIETVAARTGVDPSKIKSFLPNVTGLLQGHADAAPEGVRSMLSGIIVSLTSGLDKNKDGSIADEAVEFAKGLFGRKDH